MSYRIPSTHLNVGMWSAGCGEFDGATTDVLKLDGLNANDVTLSRSGQDLSVAINSTSETITVVKHFTSPWDGIEQIAFADGTTWDRAAILDHAWIRGTSGSDTLYGTGDADTLDGGAGNDTLNGSDGNDTYIFGVGYGHDTITGEFDGATTDVLKLVGLNASDVT